MPKLKTELKLISRLDGAEYLTASLASSRFPVHFHDTFVIQLVRAGTDWCSVSNLAASKGEVFVHFPFATHDGGTPHKGRLAYQALYPSIDLFVRLTGMDRNEVPKGKSLATGDERVVKSVEEMFRTLDSSIHSGEIYVATRNVFLNIMEFCLSDFSGVGNASAEQKLAAARNHLVSNSSRDVSVEELSDVCGLSKFHLIRAFKKRFGITPRKFLISQRVSVAKQLMVSGVTPIQAALDAGFNDQSHLNRCFKKLTTLSPGQFRTAAINCHRDV